MLYYIQNAKEYWKLYIEREGVLEALLLIIRKYHPKICESCLMTSRATVCPSVPRLNRIPSKYDMKNFKIKNKILPMVRSQNKRHH